MSTPHLVFKFAFSPSSAGATPSLFYSEEISGSRLPSAQSYCRGNFLMHLNAFYSSDQNTCVVG